MPLLNKRQLTKWREDYTVWDAPCLGEGLYLHCAFEEKDEVKGLGAQWNPAPNGAKGGHWWMPKKYLQTICPIERDDGWSGTTEDWLNNHKMIAGHYGRLSGILCIVFAQNNPRFTKHHLIGTAADDLYIIVYKDAGIVRLMGNAAAGSDQWLSTMEARDTWALLMTSGYRKIQNEEVSS